MTSTLLRCASKQEVGIWLIVCNTNQNIKQDILSPALCVSSSLLLQAFTVVTVFNAMTFALKVTPFSVKSLSEASVAMERFKVRAAPLNFI